MNVTVGSGGTVVVDVTTTTLPLGIVEVSVATTTLDVRGNVELLVLVDPSTSTGDESFVVTLVNVPTHHTISQAPPQDKSQKKKLRGELRNQRTSVDIGG